MVEYLNWIEKSYVPATAIKVIVISAFIQTPTTQKIKVSSEWKYNRAY